MTDDDLTQRLRDAGYDDAADSVRDARIAQQLRDAGRSDLASDLEGKTEPTAPPKDPAQVEGEEFLAELRDRQSAPWKSAGKLIS